MYMDSETVCSGWLVKSPPNKFVSIRTGVHNWHLKFIKAKWRRRYFVLYKPPGSLPHHYALDYFLSPDKPTTKKGTINLDDCVTILSSLDSSNYTHLFLLETRSERRSRKYYLAADSEEDMSKWVTCLCKVCGFKVRNEEDEDEEDVERNGQRTFVAGQEVGAAGEEVSASTVQLLEAGDDRPPPSPPIRDDSRRAAGAERMIPSVLDNMAYMPTPVPTGGGGGSKEDLADRYIPLDHCRTGDVKRASTGSVPDGMAPMPPMVDEAGQTIYDRPRQSELALRHQQEAQQQQQLYQVPPQRLTSVNTDMQSSNGRTASGGRPASRDGETSPNMPVFSSGSSINSLLSHVTGGDCTTSDLSADFRYSHSGAGSVGASARGADEGLPVSRPPRPPKAANPTSQKHDLYQNLSDVGLSSQSPPNAAASLTKCNEPYMDEIYDIPKSMQIVNDNVRLSSGSAGASLLPPSCRGPPSTVVKHSYINAPPSTVRLPQNAATAEDISVGQRFDGVTGHEVSGSMSGETEDEDNGVDCIYSVPPSNRPVIAPRPPSMSGPSGITNPPRHAKLRNVSTGSGDECLIQATPKTIAYTKVNSFERTSVDSSIQLPTKAQLDSSSDESDEDDDDDDDDDGEERTFTKAFARRKSERQADSSLHPPVQPPRPSRQSLSDSRRPSAGHKPQLPAPSSPLRECEEPEDPPPPLPHDHIADGLSSNHKETVSYIDLDQGTLNKPFTSSVSSDSGLTQIPVTTAVVGPGLHPTVAVVAPSGGNNSLPGPVEYVDIDQMKTEALLKARSTREMQRKGSDT